MQTSTLVSPGRGSRGAGVPSCAYQNDMPPTTVLTVLMMPLVSLPGPVRCRAYVWRDVTARGAVPSSGAGGLPEMRVTR
ncbi:hypothetical protein GCM10010504_44390 [Streptomyces griseus]|nr:hypothetical protein GCM10010504_44390 [Streptomyces griseus]